MSNNNLRNRILGCLTKTSDKTAMTLMYDLGIMSESQKNNFFQEMQKLMAEDKIAVNQWGFCLA